VELFELDCNRLEALPPAFGELTGTVVIHIGGAICISSFFSPRLRAALKRFNVSKNFLTELPNEFGSCVSLKYICAHSNRIARLPNSIGNCAALEYIDLSGNVLTELPDDFQFLVSLIHLNVSSNRLGHLPPHLGSCRSLLRLDISNNNLAYLPQSFSELCNLEICNLDNNQIILSANRFDGLTSLKQLNMKTNKTSALFADIQFCVGLELLDLTSNQLEHLPPEVGLATSLQDLRLPYNLLTMEKLHACPELASCFSLQTLDLSHNLLDGPLPDAIGLIRMLNRMDISFNGVTSIPKSIVGLQELVHLNAERCCLDSFPDTFFYLKKLETLIVSNNRFVKFPQGVADLPSLKSLDLSDNSLRLLPRMVNRLTNLDFLDLSKNKLRALPLEFADVLESVERVELHSNPWTDLPNKWGRVWAGKHSVDGPHGYSLADAIDYLYGIRVFFGTAEVMWQAQGPMYLAGKLGLNDFVQELKARIPYSWNESYMDCVKHVFFSAREAGIFPQWHEIEDESTMRDMERLRHENAIEREAMLTRVKREEANLNAIKVAAYDMDRSNRMHFSADASAQHKTASALDTRSKEGSILTQNEVKLAKRIEIKHQKNLSRQSKIIESERDRLAKILEADKGATVDMHSPTLKKKLN
jgi:leucine-rich repeat protein SHOC2